MKKSNTKVLERELKSKRMDLMKLRKGRPQPFLVHLLKNTFKSQVVKLRIKISNIHKQHMVERKIENRLSKKLSLSVQNYGLFG